MAGILFGFGHMGRIHARRLREQGEEFVIVDPAEGHDSVVPESPEFAIIATPTQSHCTVALPLLERGIPCLIEKPLAASLEDAARLAAFPHLSVGHIERFNPTLQPVLGRSPQFFQADRLGPFSKRSLDVDVIADLMIHDLDLALMMLPGEIGDVRAMGVGVLTGHADIVNARVEIGDAVATFTASRVSREAVRKLRLVEAGVYWSVDLRARSLLKVRWGEGVLEGEPVPVRDDDPITAQQTAFLAAVRGEGGFPCPGKDALRAMKLADQIRQAVTSA